MRLFAGTPWDRPPQCERCGAVLAECTCPPARLPPETQTARVTVENRRKGKKVTIVSGLSEEGNDLPGLLTQLKTACGAGGTLQSGHLEIQGDQRQRICELLTTIGFRVK